MIGLHTSGYSRFQFNIQAHRLAVLTAASVLSAVSLSANLTYGMTLGTTATEKLTYAAASVAADLLKISVPALVLTIWQQGRGVVAVIALLLWGGAMTWSTSSAMGFAVSTREAVSASRKVDLETRHGWIVTVERAETGLAALGPQRPSSVIRADLDATVIDPKIWQWTRRCAELHNQLAQRACAPVLGLRRELAAADEAKRLETKAATARTQLATAPVVGPQPDPPATAIARITGVDEGTVRVGFALLLAGLVEAGSALGLALVSVTGRPNPPHSVPGAVSRSARRAMSRSSARNNPAPVTGLVARWVECHIHTDASSRIRARDAYSAFGAWSRERGHEPITETRFGREFTECVQQLGGSKLKKRDCSYYVGVSLL